MLWVYLQKNQCSEMTEFIHPPSTVSNQRSARALSPGRNLQYCETLETMKGFLNQASEPSQKQEVSPRGLLQLLFRKM